MPLPFFGAALGLAGLGASWQRAAGDDPNLLWISGTLAGAATLVLLLAAGDHVRRWQRGGGIAGAVHALPVLSALAPLPMVLMVLPIWLVPLGTGILSAASVLWAAGLAGHAAIAIRIWVLLLRRPQLLADATPALFVPTVGMAVAPGAAFALGHVPAASAAAFAGAVAWVCLLPAVLRRVLTGTELPNSAVPGLSILVAPPALVALAFGLLSDSAEGAALFTLISLGFLALAAILVLRRAYQAGWPDFSLAWWSATFPLAALANAALLTGEMTAAPAYDVAATGALGLASLVTVTVGLLTVRHLIRQR